MGNPRPRMRWEIENDALVSLPGLGNPDGGVGCPPQEGIGIGHRRAPEGTRAPGARRCPGGDNGGEPHAPSCSLPSLPQPPLVPTVTIGSPLEVLPPRGTLPFPAIAEIGREGKGDRRLSGFVLRALELEDDESKERGRKA